MRLFTRKWQGVSFSLSPTDFPLCLIYLYRHNENTTTSINSQFAYDHLHRNGKNVYCDHILKKYRLDEGACSFFRLHHGGCDTYMWKWRKVIEQDWFEGGKDWMHGGLSFCRMCRVAAQGWWRSRDGVITLLCLSLRTRPTLNLKKKKLTTSTRHCVCNCKESSFFLTIPLNTI